MAQLSSLPQAYHTLERAPAQHPSASGILNSMAKKLIGGSSNTESSCSAHVVVVTHFTAQFLMAAASQSAMALEIEDIPSVWENPQIRIDHRGFVVGAIMQSVAALETEIDSVMRWGVGDRPIRREMVALLEPVLEITERSGSLERFNLVLHLLKKGPFSTGTQPYQDARLVISLRNALVHYKSIGNEYLNGRKLFKALKQKNHRSPPFLKGDTDFFPHRCLSAECSSWAVVSCIALIDGFYEKLEALNPLDPHRDRLVTHRPA